MENQKIIDSMEYTYKQKKNKINFYQNRINIPENLIMQVHKTKRNFFLKNKIILLESNRYFINFSGEYELQLKIRKNLLKGTYEVIIAIDYEFYYTKVVTFKNLEHRKYEQLLQLFRKSNIFNELILKDFEDGANKYVESMFNSSVVFWSFFSLFPLVAFNLVLFIEFRETYGPLVTFYLIFTVLDTIFNFIIAIIKIDKEDTIKQRNLLFSYNFIGFFYIVVNIIIITYLFTR
ncbi:hypothetical protein DSAG12_00322 [Promethearchaeum syntrophicum]|uniref:Uncharacterized protein n=1 Tax=Promethearchaeum syntrophicum TaxID=2594042 RepID=A0A5B9D5V9_9ARCH|nr:hypothetical protein [Candidatus Prometheoarchaeum syntrophicum]QEE14509.1 hypothetical protein DSAG12_00322 [Candidatus Prometheoarchaeum syntrophicum]